VKLVFLGSGTFGLKSLEALIDADHPPVLLVTQPPRRRRRHGDPEPTPTQSAAEAAGIPVATPVKVNENESLDRLRAAGADLFVVAEYGQILSRDLLDIPRLGAINVHASLLPRHRGASPVAAAILAGDQETGITIQRMVRRLDAGPLLAERRAPILPDDTTGTLTARLAPLGGDLLVEVVGALANDEAMEAREQDESRATMCRRLTREDALIDWTRSAAHIERQVRAMSPNPGAYGELQREPGLGLVIRTSQVVEGSAEPGVVAAISSEGFDVGTAEGLLRVLQLVPAARKRMSARDFVNGYRLSAGERFQ
jgi:methionyl-tRNA formyltransferase